MTKINAFLTARHANKKKMHHKAASTRLVRDLSCMAPKQHVLHKKLAVKLCALLTCWQTQHGVLKSSRHTFKSMRYKRDAQKERERAQKFRCALSYAWVCYLFFVCVFFGATSIELSLSLDIEIKIKRCSPELACLWQRQSLSTHEAYQCLNLQPTAT